MMIFVRWVRLRLCRASGLFPDYLHEDFEELVTELAAGSQTVALFG